MELNSIQKAVLVNRLMKVRFTGTPIAECTIDRVVASYNYKNCIIIDSYLFKHYGLFYKDYIGFIDGITHAFSIIIDVIRLDKALDKKLKFWKLELPDDFDRIRKEVLLGIE